MQLLSAMCLSIVFYVSMCFNPEKDCSLIQVVILPVIKKRVFINSNIYSLNLFPCFSFARWCPNNR